MADPRAPVIPVGIEVDTNNYLVRADGEIRRNANVILKEEDMGRIRAGYVCARCFEVQETPFPTQCYLCKFPMADKQSEYVAKAYEGSVRVGPQTNADTEIAAMEEAAERRRRAMRDPITRPSQILLPGKDF